MEIMRNIQNTEHKSGIQHKKFSVLVEINENTLWLSDWLILTDVNLSVAISWQEDLYSYLPVCVVFLQSFFFFFLSIQLRFQVFLSYTNNLHSIIWFQVSKDELISDVLLCKKQDDQLKFTYSSYVKTQDVTLKICQRRWIIGRSGERGSGISVLAA